MRRLLSLRNVGLRFGAVSALERVDLDLHAGERLALVGSNGSGKSSLLRVLHGLLRPTTGSLQADPGLRQAMVFQRPFMLRMSVQNNVALGLWLSGTGWRAAHESALHGLDRVGLRELAARSARGLSGGQQQRVALARAWVRQPALWLLDEPTASLDPHAKREIEALMATFAQGEPGHPMTMVFASHNLGQVKRLASRVIYLEHGRVLADLPVADFFHPQRLKSVSGAADLFVKGELA
ncbi:MAG: phosphate ABC transporter ATP-binding protein [Rhodoferax sp.]|nr:phosphate ABC transporter ATP-binding protein [Rhodoferax sp.]